MPTSQAVKALDEAGYGKREMFTTGMAADVWGLSAGQVRRLGIPPDDIYVNRYRQVCSLYTRDTVLRLHDDPYIRAAPNRRTDWRTVFERQYGSPRAALADAASCLYELNHYAKVARTSATQKRVYQLKGRFIRFLHDQGYCVSVYRHQVHYDARECGACDGHGWGRCQHSGVWEPGKTVALLCFHFLIDGRRFSWHQPEREVRWLPRDAVCDPPNGTDWELGHSQPECARSPSARAYALIEWVMEDSSDE